MPLPELKRESRAVERVIEAGEGSRCVHCRIRVKFVARTKARQVICNVYVAGVWARTEHYHSDCYAEAGEPHGPAAAPVSKLKRRPA